MKRSHREREMFQNVSLPFLRGQALNLPFIVTPIVACESFASLCTSRSALLDYIHDAYVLLFPASSLASFLSVCGKPLLPFPSASYIAADSGKMSRLPFMMGSGRSLRGKKTYTPSCTIAFGWGREWKYMYSFEQHITKLSVLTLIIFFHFDRSLTTSR